MATLKPPFRAKNMHELYKKVSRGMYPAMPSVYSKELGKIVGAMLRVSSKNRPTASEILQMDSIRCRLQLYGMNEDPNSEEDDILLQTIRLPNSGKIKQISSQLPKSNYGECSTQSSRKSQHSKEQTQDSILKHSKTKSAYTMETQDDKKQKLEAILQNSYPMKKDKVSTKTNDAIPKYYAVGERRSIGKQNSSRNYGIDVSDYIFLSNNAPSANLTREKLKSKRENNLMKLK